MGNQIIHVNLKNKIMKNKIIYALVIAWSCLSICQAQTIEKRQINIGGLTLNAIYSEAQIRTIMGQPSVFRHDVDVCDSYMFIYNTNIFYLNDGVFSGFTLRDNSYKLNNLVYVGASISTINIIRPFKVTNYITKDGNNVYCLYITNSQDDLSPLMIYAKEGVITEISYFYADEI